MVIKPKKPFIPVGVPTKSSTSMFLQFHLHSCIEMLIRKMSRTKYSQVVMFVSRRAPAVYVNVFTGEATTQFQSVTQSARGGVSLFCFKGHSYTHCTLFRLYIDSIIFLMTILDGSVLLSLICFVVLLDCPMQHYMLF